MSGHASHWTPREEEELRRMWGSHSLNQVAAHFGRTEKAIYWRARKVFGPETSCPQGMESMLGASLRTGYGHNAVTLRRILKWAGVRVVKAYARPSPGFKAFVRWIVDAADVDSAVDRWHKTETARAGAARVGLTYRGLLMRLEWMGITEKREAKAEKASAWARSLDRDPGPRARIRRIAAGRRGHGSQAGTRLHIRIESSLIDRAATIETLRHAAGRVGKDEITLAKWLKVSGVTKAASRVHWWLFPEVVDEVVARKGMPPGTESLEDAAHRTGQDKAKLSRWMRAAGYRRTAGAWVFKPDDVDAVVVAKLDSQRDRAERRAPVAMESAAE